eukprot:2691024-Amphidinium_carterae.1
MEQTHSELHTDDTDATCENAYTIGVIIQCPSHLVLLVCAGQHRVTDGSRLQISNCRDFRKTRMGLEDNSCIAFALQDPVATLLGLEERLGTDYLHHWDPHRLPCVSQVIHANEVSPPTGL